MELGEKGRCGEAEMMCPDSALPLGCAFVLLLTYNVQMQVH